MKTNPFDIAHGLGLWVILLSQPMIQEITSTKYHLKFIMTYVVFPILLMFFSRMGRFWINQTTLIASILFAATMTWVLQYYGYINGDPDVQSDKGDMTFIAFFAMMVTVLSMVAFPMYRMSNFN